MSFVTDTPGFEPAPIPQSAPHLHLGRLLRSERIKMTSTKTWWLFGIGIVAGTGLALLFNCARADSLQFQVGPVALTEGEISNILTSGQFFSGLFVMLLAILLITNEYYHQTATSTFLATPRRSSIVLSKFVVAVLAAATAWAVTTVVSLVFGGLWLNSQGIGLHLGSWTVQRAILVNLLVYALWSILGIGVGALIRSQIGATVTSVLLYTIGQYAALAVFALMAEVMFHNQSLYKGMVLVPSIAAQIAATPGISSLPGDQSVAWWVGVIVMVAYGGVTATVGTLILRKRDIS